MPTNQPNFNGRRRGDEIRRDGWVWKWNGEKWSPQHRTQPSDRATVPEASKYRAMLPDHLRHPNEGGGNRESGQPDNQFQGGGGGRKFNDGGGGGSRTGRSNSAGGGGGNNNGGGGSGGGGGESLRGIPDGGKIWKVGDQYFAVYTVPKSDPPVQLAYRFRNKEEANRISTGGGIDVARSMSPEQFRKSGVLPSGPVDFIANQSEHPFDRFRHDFAREVKFKPWLADPDFQALIARSILEGRSPSLSEIQDTDWYRNHSDVEREKLELYYGDRKTWKQQRNQAEARIKEAMNAAGYTGGKERVAAYLARELMFGRIRDDDQLAREIEQLSNPLVEGAKRSAGFDRPERGKAVKINGEIFWRVRQNGKIVDYRMGALEQAKYGHGATKAFHVQGGNEQGRQGFGGLLREGGGPDLVGTVDGYEATRRRIIDGIGPVLAAGWSQRKIAEWAQRIAENPAAVDELDGKLKGIRKSHYKGYDPELSYRDIADVGQAQVWETWGRRMNEKNPLFQQVLQLNDQAKAKELLWQEGLDRGVDSVMDRALSAFARTQNGGVQRSMI